MSAQVICAVDDSSASLEAGRFAATFSRELGIPLQLVHVVPSRGFGRRTRGSRRKETAEEGARLLKGIADELRIAAKAGLHFGDPGGRLMEVAAEEEAALLIIGSGSGSKRVGSVTRHAVAKAPCPVIVVASRRGSSQRMPF